MEPGGFCIEYDAAPNRAAELIAAAAGPIAGLLYMPVAARFGAAGELSAGISLLLSLLNLIPAQPLDGGRIAAALLSGRAASRLSAVCAAVLTGVGLWLFFRGRGAGLALFGICLLCRQIAAQGSSSAMLPD